MNFNRRPWPQIYGLIGGLALGCIIIGIIGAEMLFDLAQAFLWALTGYAVPIPQS